MEIIVLNCDAAFGPTGVFIQIAPTLGRIVVLAPDDPLIVGLRFIANQKQRSDFFA